LGWVTESTPEPYSLSPRDLAHDLLACARDLSSADTRIALSQAHWLADARRDFLHHEHGFASFADWARERLHLEPRTARRRIALHHALAQTPALEAPLLQGRIGICQTLLLANPPPLVGDSANAAHRESGDGPAAESSVDGDQESAAASVCQCKRDSTTAQACLCEQDSAAAQVHVCKQASVTAWVRVAEQESVSRLRQLIHEARVSQPGDDSANEKDGADAVDTEDTPSRAITFQVPAATGILFDETVELARRRLGWQAPRHEAFDAMLTEVESSLPPVDAAPGGNAGGESGNAPSGDVRGELNTAFFVGVGSELNSAPGRNAEDGPAPNAARRVIPTPDAHTHPGALAHAKAALRTARRELARLETGADIRPIAVGPRTERADRTVDHLRYLDSLGRPLHVLRAGTLLALRDMAAWRFTGHASFVDLVETELGLSERSARDLMNEAHRFENDPHLAWAYESGEIGAGQARLIYPFTNHHNRNAWIQRASTVTHTQLERETRLLTRLDLVAPSIHNGDPFPGGVPVPGRVSAPGLTEISPGVETVLVDPAPGMSTRTELESTLFDRAGDLGWTHSMLNAALPGPLVSNDPAQDPQVLERLTALLDLIELELRPEHTTNPDLAPAAHPAINQGIAPTTHTGDADQDNCSSAVLDRQTLSTRRRDRHLVLRLPHHVYAHWLELAYRIQCQNGPLPDWVILTLITHAARTEWLRLDPDARPREHRVLERDGWRCRAPGCTARRMLEVHHITFRSQGGSNADSNKITLCHAHHRRGIHDRSARLKGQAPADLYWRLGRQDSRYGTDYYGELRHHVNTRAHARCAGPRTSVEFIGGR